VIAIAKAAASGGRAPHREGRAVDFTECFIVGTAAEVTPVSEIGEFKFQPAALSLGLMDDYARLVRNETPAVVPA
jgi:branched-chain amino acid aminotransferase